MPPAPAGGGSLISALKRIMFAFSLPATLLVLLEFAIYGNVGYISGYDEMDNPVYSPVTCTVPFDGTTHYHNTAEFFHTSDAFNQMAWGIYGLENTSHTVVITNSNVGRNGDIYPLFFLLPSPSA